jgi:HK97 family phage major capsid protein
VAEVADIDAQVKRIESRPISRPTKPSTDAVREAAAKCAHDKRDPSVRLFDKWLRGGDEGLTPRTGPFIRNTMSTTTTTEGGYTVPSLISSQLIDAMKAYGAMRAVADRDPDGRRQAAVVPDLGRHVGNRRVDRAEHHGDRRGSERSARCP